MFNKFKLKYGIKSNSQLVIIFIVFVDIFLKGLAHKVVFLFRNAWSQAFISYECWIKYINIKTQDYSELVQ